MGSGEPFDTRDPLMRNETILFSSPIFRDPNKDESKKYIFDVPLGAEGWVPEFMNYSYSREALRERFMAEYVSIAYSMKQMEIPFVIIISHRELIDENLLFDLMQMFDVRGVQFDNAIKSTIFPRDMLVDFDGCVYTNSESNVKFDTLSSRQSPLGEGGRVLKLGKKIFAPDPRGFEKVRQKYNEDVNRLATHFDFGFLPLPWATRINTRLNTETCFVNDHLDRVAAFIKGKDGRDYLLLDENYVTINKLPVGNYMQCISEVCKGMNVTPVVIKRAKDSIPYALNLEQFTNGKVLMTGGDRILAEILKEIVGEGYVYQTNVPTLLYPLIRGGAIRCMLLHAPKKIIGEPVISSKK